MCGDTFMESQRSLELPINRRIIPVQEGSVDIRPAIFSGVKRLSVEKPSCGM
ncbi:MAG: hypothetical protein K0S45_2825 [Nitrospira sp.]|jgi:hypothetical protein|nr:hypothetical protein [Nitrospira sp.]